MGISIWQLLILLGFVFILLVPCLAALASKKARGWQKFSWFAISLLFSWIGYVAFYFLFVRSADDPRPDGRIHPRKT